MPGAARVISSTDYYHTIMRGQNKEYIFNTDEYKAYFFETLRKIEEEGD